MGKKEKIKSYYESNMAKAKHDFEKLGWESKEAHNKRFEVLVREVDLKGRKILDIGCGLGNLLEYLTEKGIEVDYYGVDILEQMIECARKKKLDGRFYCTDIFKQNPFADGTFDVVYASGIFNLNLGNNKEFLEQALNLFFRLSRDYVVFNLLHYKSPGREDKYFYFDPREVETLLKRDFDISEVRVADQYLNNDFTVVCRKAKLAKGEG